MSSQAKAQDSRLALNWVNTLFIVAAHLLAVLAVILMAQGHFASQSIVLAIAYLVVCSFSISAGYHRLFSHASYKASRPWKLLMLLFGAASVQNSAIAWSSDHRRHHRFVDQDKDPYNIQEGFWWAHIGWVFFDKPVEDIDRVGDLRKDKLLVWQNKHYLGIAIVMAGILPFGLGLLWGDPLGALLLACFLRLVIQWHITFTINSLAHMVGSQPYSTKNSARDSWLIALVSWGEGYHNFHHRFGNDYRNGARWWQFDPPKWLLWTLAKFKLVTKLKRTNKEQIRLARKH